jgi:hypothetical protein
MTTNRREFIERLGATAVLGVVPMPALRALESPGEAPMQQGTQQWDFSWTNALKGKKHKALFDNAEVESGYGVWRASFWEAQYQEALGAKPADIRTVLVLRHNAIALAFQQSLWDQAKIGETNKVTHPVTLQSTDRNPALMTAARNEVPQMFDAFALPNFMSRGGIVLACNLALSFFAADWAKRAGITPEEATRRAVAALVPGVKLMPSGVMACVKAQEEGCVYVKAS